MFGCKESKVIIPSALWLAIYRGDFIRKKAQTPTIEVRTDIISTQVELFLVRTAQHENQNSSTNSIVYIRVVLKTYASRFRYISLGSYEQGVRSESWQHMRARQYYSYSTTHSHVSSY